MKPCKLPKTEGFILKYIVLPLWPTYIGERRTPFSKAYGIKVRWYGEHVGENIANLGNIVQTHWKAIKNEKRNES
jgi:hypothetical protein